MSDKISFCLNGTPVDAASAPGEKLLDVLRNEFNVTGVKCGCREGECGACSVLIDGLLANSCLVALGAVAGKQVVTIEGLSKTAPEHYEALQKAFGKVSAVQCGFCTPGMVLAAEALLCKNPAPTEAEIREGISGNLCRCTGYNAIVEAVKIAAKEGKGLW